MNIFIDYYHHHHGNIEKIGNERKPKEMKGNQIKSNGHIMDMYTFVYFRNMEGAPS